MSRKTTVFQHNAHHALRAVASDLTKDHTIQKPPWLQRCKGTCPNQAEAKQLRHVKLMTTDDAAPRITHSKRQADYDKDRENVNGTEGSDPGIVVDEQAGDSHAIHQRHPDVAEQFVSPRTFDQNKLDNAKQQGQQSRARVNENIGVGGGEVVEIQGFGHFIRQLLASTAFSTS
jgi:hypothetical protein